MKELPDLIGLGLPTHQLQVHQPRDVRMGEEMMAAGHPHEPETEALDAAHDVVEGDIPNRATEPGV